MDSCIRCGKATELSLDGKIAICKTCIRSVIDNDQGMLSGRRKNAKKRMVIPVVGTEFPIPDRNSKPLVLAARGQGNFGLVLLLHAESPYFEVGEWRDDGSYFLICDYYDLLQAVERYKMP